MIRQWFENITYNYDKRNKGKGKRNPDENVDGGSNERLPLMGGPTDGDMSMGARKNVDGGSNQRLLERGLPKSYGWSRSR